MLGPGLEGDEFPLGRPVRRVHQHDTAQRAVPGHGQERPVIGAPQV